MLSVCTDLNTSPAEVCNLSKGIFVYLNQISRFTLNIKTMIGKIKRLLLRRTLTFMDYAHTQARKAKEDGSFSRSANYITAIRSFTNAVGIIKLRNVTAQTVVIYQDYLKRKGITSNTISCYNRTLRAIYNKAVTEGLVRDRRPFQQVYTGRAKTQKRSISEECIRKLKGLDLSDEPKQQMFLDFFLFGFYTMGMPFIDIACLKRNQIVGNSLYYNRHKNGQPITIPLCDEALAIIKKYKTETQFIFPIITEVNLILAYRQYCSCLNAYNRHLKRIAKKAELTDNLTSYTVRHSWASIAYKSDVPLAVISQALGHRSADTTMTYIRELDEESLRNGNLQVINSISVKPK